MSVFFMDLCLQSAFHFFWELELNQDVLMNFSKHLSFNVSSFESSEKIVKGNNSSDPCQITLGQKLQFLELFILPIYTRFLTLN